MTPDQITRIQLHLGVTMDAQFGPVTYAALFNRMAGVGLSNAEAFGRGAAKHFPAYEINTPLRLAHFMAQTYVESCGFTRLIENLNYSAKRLCQVWPTRFLSLAAATPYASNPALLAERVYGGRLGNVNAGDGSLFLGRGLMQMTGRENYTKCAARTGLDLASHPELAADPETAIHIACDYWGSHCINPLADADDIETITRKVNGGLNGIDDRKKMLSRAKGIIL